MLAQILCDAISSYFVIEKEIASRVYLFYEYEKNIDYAKKKNLLKTIIQED